MSNDTPLRRAEETPPKAHVFLAAVCIFGSAFVFLAGAWKCGELVVEAILFLSRVHIVVSP